MGGLVVAVGELGTLSFVHAMQILLFAVSNQILRAAKAAAVIILAALVGFLVVQVIAVM